MEHIQHTGMITTTRSPPVSVRRQVEIAHAQWARDHRQRLLLLAARARADARNRQYHSNRREPQSTRWMTYEQLQSLNRAMAFEPLSEVDKTRLEEEAARESSDEVLDRKVCVVTDAWVFPREAVCLPVADFPFGAMRAVLSGGSWCTQPMRDCYDCSSFHPNLRGLLLSPRAFERGEDNRIYAWFSKCALNHLQALETRFTRASDTAVDPKPPRFAIADCFITGTFDELDRLTIIERQAIGLAQIRGVVKVVYGGPGNVLHSHLLCWDNRTATIASSVPTLVNRDYFSLVLAGPMTQAQELLLAKRHDCNATRVREAHELLARINHLYAHVQRNIDFEWATGSDHDIYVRYEPNGVTERLIAEARARQASVARMQEDTDSSDSTECNIVETHTVLIETTADTSEEERLARAVATVTCADNSFVARRSTTLLKTTDPHYIERLFAHLLPFGIGGFSVNRCHRYSERAIVLHYLRLSTNRFAEDPLFKLVMFDYLATARVKNGVFIRVGRDPALASSIMRISPSELKTAMQNRVNQRRAWKLGRTFTPRQESSTAARCLKSINATAAKMWGSNEERESMARKVDAMAIKFGAPSIFWTLTPNPDCSIACAFWTCKPLPGGRPARLQQCSALNMPCASEMSRIVMANTMVQAEYYKLCCKLLIDVLFGWDSTVNKPKSQRGIFGFVEGLVYALEQQGRLFIHHHGVAWIAGLPRTQEDWDRLRTNEQLKQRFERYCASIFAAELPVYDVLDYVPCPRSECNGELSSIPIHKKFKHLLKSTVAPPLVAVCSSCNSTFTECDIVNNVIELQWNALDENNKAISSSDAVDQLKLRFGGLSQDPATARVQLSRLLLKDQIHSYTHTPSCIKGRSGTKCRYNFFRRVVQSTELDKNDEIQYRRCVGNQWINTYVPTWRRVLHFNMDARVLLSGESLQASRYAIQYTVKRQSVLDNVAVVDMAFKRRVQREAGLESTEHGKGVGRLLSLAYSTSGVMEMGGPLATAILLVGEAVTFSCSFQRLVVVEGLNMLKDMPVEATVVSRNHALYAETSIGKYMARPACLENVCWYEFCSWFHDDATNTATRTVPCTFVTNNTQELRSHIKKHGYRYFDFPRVPKIIGPRLPDATRLRREDYADQTELYYRMATLLYRPFRDPRAILRGGNSAESCFEEWNPFHDPETKAALAHHQHYYDCLKAAQEYREKQRTCVSDDGEDEEECHDDDVIQHRQDQSHGESRSILDYVTLPGELYSVEDESDFCGDTVVPVLQDNEPTPMDELLSNAISSSVLPPDDTLHFTANSEAITRNQISSFLQNTITSANVIPRAQLHSGTQTTDVIIEAFARTIRNLNFDDTTAAPREITAYAPIRAVSSYFKLNCKQHIAFTLIATPLLSKITGVPLDSHQAKLLNNDPIIVTGAGGTGKSRIVAAVRALVDAWGRPDAVKVVASTGIAAASLAGSTMHASVNLGPHAKQLPKHITCPSDMLLQSWSPTLCIIADELSMTNLAFFGLWEEALRHIKESRKASFGGMIMVLMFDHCQLKTVSGAPLYKPATGFVSATPSEEHGRKLYQAISKCVYLTESMRFTQDPLWGEWMSSARLGDWTPELRNFIASIPQSGCNNVTSDINVIQTISTDNITRCLVNRTAINIAIRTLQPERRVYVVLPRLSRPVSVEELAVLRQLPDNKTGGIPMFLHLYIGMPVRVKANQCVATGVANGATGEVYHVDWRPGNEFVIQPNGAWMASTQPSNIYVNLANCPTSTRFPRLPGHWPSSVMPILQTTTSITWSGSTLSIKGFPIVPAFGTTVHGIQGETRAAIAITNLRPPHVHRVDPHALYVALSRLRTRAGLHWIGQRPTKEDYAFFHPNPDVIIEDRRLKNLSKTTIAIFDELTGNRLATCTS